MSNQDFVRQLEHDDTRALAEGQGLAARLHIDVPLLLLLLALFGVAMVVLYSATGQVESQVIKQAMHFLIGAVVMLGLAQLDPRVYQRWSLWVYLIGLGFLIAVLFVGVGAKGAQRWLEIPGVTRFQPSELMKLCVSLTVAAYLTKRTIPPQIKHIMAALGLILLPAILIARQPDLGTAILIASSGALVLFFAGLQWRWIFGSLTVLAASLPILWNFVLHEYQKTRVMTLFNPESDVLGAGWNITQSKTAIGSGGVFGKGWLNGTQSQLEFLPESHTDFIIAVLAEEWGLVGVSALLGLYMLIIVRGLYIAANARDSFGRLVAGSLTVTFFVYLFVNIGMVSGLLPVVGVPLPLVSYGGTSVVSLLALFGILMSIQTHKKH